MTQPTTLISQAMLDIGALASGETLAGPDANDGFSLLQQMLDSWGNMPQIMFYKNELIHELTGGTFQYTLGTSGGSIVSTFTGSISGSVLTITAVTSGAVSTGMIISGAGITANSTIISYGTGFGGNSTGALGTYNLSQSTTSFASGTITAYAVRPLRINSAFVRVVNSATGVLDYPMAVINLEKYELIGIKTLPGPWPRAVYYQPSEPLGVLNYWPNPSSGEVHLFCDPVMTAMASITDTIVFPQGYELAIRRNLAMELLPMYPGLRPAEYIAMIAKGAKESLAAIKKTNMQPPQPSNFDTSLLPGKTNDAGWILSSGYY